MTSLEEQILSLLKKAPEQLMSFRQLIRDLDLDDSGGATFRTKLRLSFKYEDEA